MDIGKPYKNLLTTENYIIREFGHDIDPIELKWHRDREDRLIKVLEVGDNWKFQKDNELPLTLTEGDCIFIPTHIWHRVIKGNDKLKIQIFNYEPNR